jgi:hypothetical protein
VLSFVEEVREVHPGHGSLTQMRVIHDVGQAGRKMSLSKRDHSVLLDCWCRLWKETHVAAEGLKCREEVVEPVLGRVFSEPYDPGDEGSFERRSQFDDRHGLGPGSHRALCRRARGCAYARPRLLG